MKQFDVVRHVERSDLLLLIIQHDLLNDLNARAVVPLKPKSEIPNPIGRLNPVLTVGRKKYIMDTTNVAGVSVRRLGEKVTNLRNSRDEIIGAMDFLMCGF